MGRELVIKKFKIGESLNRKISTRLVKEIIKTQRDLQREENIKRGRKARHISFIFASDIIARRLNK